MFERVKLKKINDHVILMNDNNEGTGYIVIGKSKALIIDTMNGYENVKEIAETVTDLPFTVVNTHGHGDHIFGNIYFDKVYMHPSDFSLAESFFALPEFKELNKTGYEPAEMLPVSEGDIIDLGGIELEIFHVPGHTAGGICLLLRKDRILFTGDSIIEQTWMQLPESLSMETFYSSLDKLSCIRNDFDIILTGHSRDAEDASLYEAHKNAVHEVIEHKNENDEPFEWFGGVSLAHPYGKPPRRIVYK